jgi:hypothetical protein
MAAQDIEMHPSGAETGNGPTTGFPVSTATMAHLYVDVTADDFSTLDMWLEGRDEASGEWYPIPPDQTADSSTRAAKNGPDLDTCDVVDGGTGTGEWIGVYKHLAADHVRLNWTLSGTSATFKAILKVK